MKAIVCNDFGPIQNIEYKDVKEPIILEKSVIINVKSVGVNFPDGLLVQGKYQLKPETPFIPGMEVAGEILKVGTGILNFKIGDKVAALSQLSGYAEQAVVQQNSVFKIPSKMSFDDSCALLCAYGTSHYALKQRAKLQKEELLVVLGASGSTGIAAIQIGKVMVANVIAVSSNGEKQKIAKENGADISIGYDNLKEELKSISNGKGVDVIFISGDYGQFRAGNQYTSSSGVTFLGSGILSINKYNERFSRYKRPNSVLIFNHDIVNRKLKWKFKLIDDIH